MGAPGRRADTFFPFPVFRFPVSEKGPDLLPGPPLLQTYLTTAAVTAFLFIIFIRNIFYLVDIGY